MTKRLSVVDVDLCVGCQSCMFACNRRFAEAGVARSAIHIQSAGGFERGFVVKVCRACSDPPCAKVCPTGALQKRTGGGVLLNHDKCNSCGNCAKECIIGGVNWDTTLDKPAICVHCGYCAKYCPYGVIRLEELLVGEA
jgi:carbon-monoxide dehydrogenase iron sulfur subunit